MLAAARAGRRSSRLTARLQSASRSVGLRAVVRHGVAYEGVWARAVEVAPVRGLSAAAGETVSAEAASGVSAAELLMQNPLSGWTLGRYLDESLAEGATRHALTVVGAGTGMEEAVKLMREKDISSLVVATGGVAGDLGEAGATALTLDQVAGMVEERDVAFRAKLTPGEPSSAPDTVEDVMLPSVLAVHRDTPAEDALRALLQHGARHLVVTREAAAPTSSSAAAPWDGDAASLAVAGVVSLRDLVALVAREQAVHYKACRRALRREALPARLTEFTDLDTLEEMGVPGVPAAEADASVSPSSSDSSSDSEGLVAGSEQGRMSAQMKAAARAATEDADRALRAWTSARHEAVLGRRVWTAEDLLALQRAQGREFLLNCQSGDAVTVRDAIQHMADRQAGCIAVVGPDGHLEGLFTTRDFLQHIVVGGGEADRAMQPLRGTRGGGGLEAAGQAAAAGKDWRSRAANTLVESVMTRGVRAAQASWTLNKCADLMLRRKFRHLPVVDEAGTVLGVLSMGDMARALLAIPEAQGSDATDGDGDGDVTLYGSSRLSRISPAVSLLAPQADASDSAEDAALRAGAAAAAAALTPPDDAPKKKKMEA